MTAECEHALLSASGSHRWLNCPPSARLEEPFPDTESEYTLQGTLAHAIAELKLRKYSTPVGPRKYNNELKKLQADPLYAPEMLQHTDTYMDHIKEVVHSFDAPPYILAEKRLDYSHVAPEGFGTGDCIIIGGSTLHVIDFKYGQGVPVSAERNPQMMLYALGALREYALLYAIDKLVLTIIQPRLNTIDVWETTVAELENWADEIRPTAQLAYAGQGEYAAGDWCRFCRAKAQCRHRADRMTALEAFGTLRPPLLSNDEVGDILERAQTLKAWVSDLEDYALSALLAGDAIAGWKAVEGRSNRQFADVDAAFSRLQEAGYQEAMLYERRPITLTAVEKLLGQKQFVELLSDYVQKPPGKPTLAPETDKREAITNKMTAEQAFQNI